MALRNRINQSKIKFLTNQFKKYHVQIPYNLPINRAAGSLSPRVLENPFWGSVNRPPDFCYNVRFFGSRIPMQSKKEVKEPSGLRLNDQITAEFVRLVTDEGHGVVSLHEALQRARKLELDLVEVQGKAKPPVCKLMAFHKEKYKQKQKEKERTKSKSGTTLRKGNYKEVRFAGKTEEKDLKMKADMVIRLMDQGYRVKCMAVGDPKRTSSTASDPGDQESEKKENEAKEELRAVLSRFSSLIQAVSVVESGPFVEKRQAYAIVRHARFGSPKKGGAKKKEKVTTAQPTSNGFASTETPVMFEEEPAESGTEGEDEILSYKVEVLDKNLEDDKNTWSVADSTNDFGSVGESGDNAKGSSLNPSEKISAVPKPAYPRAGFNAPNFSHPMPVDDSKNADRLPYAEPLPPHETENRYKRREPRNQFPQASMDYRGPGKRDSSRFEPRFSKQRREPPSQMNASPPVGERKEVGTGPTPAFRNSKPPHETPKREASPPDAAKPASSYGIFSSPTGSVTGKRGSTADFNKNRTGYPFDSARTSNTEVPVPNPNLPSPKSDVGQSPGSDQGGLGGYGTFSRGSSSVSPNRISKPN